MDFFRFLIVFLLTAGIGMGAFWLWLRERRRTLPASDHSLETLREENAQLQAQLEARLAEFEERLDFVERRLVQERDRPRLPETRAKTPV